MSAPGLADSHGVALPVPPAQRSLAWAREQWLLALASAIWLVAAVGMLLLTQHADDRRRAQVLLADTRGQAYHLEAAEWEAIAQGRLRPDAIQQLRQAERQLSQSTAQLQALLPSTGPISGVVSALDAYEAAVR